MAITVAMRTEITQLYVALFGRAPDSEGLGFWVTLRNQGQSLTQIANTMYATAPAREYYPAFLTNKEIIESFYENVLGRAPGTDLEGIAFWEAKLNVAGATPGSVITQMIAVVANYTGTDPAGLESKALFNNRVEVAQYYAEEGGDIANATIVLDGVNSDPDSVDAAIAAIDSGAIGGAGGVSLTTGLDVIMGSGADETFQARVVQNGNGEQTNQLATGDQINGGGGDDTLVAKVIMASALNDSPDMAITPETVDVENVLITALSTGGSSEEVVLNAKYMLGLDLVGSVQSDASLIVSNLTTLTDSGVYADRRNTEDVVIRMDHTGNGDAVEAESCLTVLFDQDYLLAGQTSDAKAFYWLLDEQAELQNNPNRLQRIDVDGLRFKINGGPIITLSDRASWSADLMVTHTSFIAALQNELAALIAAGTVPAGTTLTLDTVNTDNTGLDDGSISDPIPAMVLTLTNGQTVEPVGFSRVEEAIGAYDVYGTFDDTPLAIADLPITATIELEKVGRGSDGGCLTVGGMSTDGENVWDSGSGSKGIERFNITVSGDETQPSSLSSLQSTNNTLEIVNVVSAAGSVADLTIGNSQTPGGLGNKLASPVWQAVGNVIAPSDDNVEALKDVRVFDASGFNGNLTLFAGLTSEVVPKYMNLMDQAPAQPAADNVQFFYAGGTGDDYINLWIDDANLAAAGTTTREDFVLNINGNDGDDEIITMIGDGSAVSFGTEQGPVFANWYQNSAINANLNIDGNAGDDTIRTLGSGDWIIDGGAGADTIYADNTGGEDSDFNDGKAAWVLNAVNTDVDDLLSQTAASVSAVNAQVTVNFMGYSKTVAINNSVGSLTNVTINDLHINQAIKQAINSDPVLSQLLVAEDGPARTLVVRSLIDGRMNDGEADYDSVNTIDNLSIRFTSATMTTAQTAIGSLVQFTTAAAPTGTLLNGYNPAGDATFGTDDSGTLWGADSTNVADNQIEGNTGNDVIVLGTGMWSNDTLVYDGFNNGTDSIVNFEDSTVAGWNSSDYETVTLAFTASDGDPVAQTITFDGVTANLAAPTLQGIIPPLDVASQFVNQYNAAAATNNWFATLGTFVPGSPAVAGVAEVFDATFVGDSIIGESITFDGVTVNLGNNVDGTAVAADFVTQYMAVGNEATTTWDAVAVGNVVTFTSELTGARMDVAAGDFVDSPFLTITPSAPSTQGVTAAAAVADTYTVTLVHDTPGAVPDLTAAAFTGTYFATNPDPDGQGVVTVAVTDPAVDNFVAGTKSTFTVTYTTATTAVTAAGAGTVTNPASADQGDGALTLANELVTAGVAGFGAGVLTAAADGSSYSVKFTALANGPTAIPADTTFGLGATATDGVNGTFTSTLGVADSTTPPVFTIVPDTDFDYIDFSAYDPTGVVVTDTNQAAQVVIGTANGVAAKWITMTESTTNDGEYVINLVTSTVAGAADDTIQLIGVADFGYEKDFTVDTFVI